jgi:hypothetical protein
LFAGKSRPFERLQSKLFWIWNNIIGLPQKNGEDKPLIKGSALM